MTPTQWVQSKIKSGEALKIKLDIPFLSAPSSAAVSFSLYWQRCFDEVVKNDSIVLFEGIVTSKASTDNNYCYKVKFVRPTE